MSKDKKTDNATLRNISIALFFFIALIIWLFAGESVMVPTGHVINASFLKAYKILYVANAMTLLLLFAGIAFPIAKSAHALLPSRPSSRALFRFTPRTSGILILVLVSLVFAWQAVDEADDLGKPATVISATISDKEVHSSGSSRYRHKSYHLFFSDGGHQSTSMASYNRCEVGEEVYLIYSGDLFLGLLPADEYTLDM